MATDYSYRSRCLLMDYCGIKENTINKKVKGIVYHFETREDLGRFVTEEVLNSAETIEFLEISRERLSQLIKDGKLLPIKKMLKDSLFLKTDLEEKKKELETTRKKYQPFDTLDK